MIGDIDCEKFKLLSDAHIPKMTAKLWSKQIENFGFSLTDESFKKYRQGKAKPSSAVIYAMSRILGVHYFELLEGLEPPKVSEVDVKYNKLSDIDKDMIMNMINRMLENDKS